MKHKIYEPDKTRRHQFKFTESELVDILQQFLVSAGFELPEGEPYLIGLEHNQKFGIPNDEDTITFCINEKG